jgi:hypothetical protein
MKRSELKNEIGAYRLTPDSWGDNCIMIDEDAVCQASADAAGVDVSEYDPDGYDNNRPDSVVVWTDANGKFYAVMVPFTNRQKETFNDNLYRACQNPGEATDGGALLYGQTWKSFEDDE